MPDLSKIETTEENINKTKWSYSRVSTYATCPLQYKYHYIEKWESSVPVNTEAADKGTVFHETVEQYKTGEDHDKMWNILLEKAKEYNVDVNKYDYVGAMNKFYAFWDIMIASKEKEGWTVKQEDWVDGDINGEYFRGALDLYLYNDSIKNEDGTHGKIIIYDYKSGKSPDASKYKNQQVLYAYLEGMKRGWSYEQIVSNVKLYLFFPLAPVTGLTIEDQAKKCIREIKFDVDTIAEVVENFYKYNINKIHATDWEQDDVKGSISYSCNWCQYCGSKPNAEGFGGCPYSCYAKELDESVKFTKRITG